MNKPLRTFQVQLGPAVLPAGNGAFEILCESSTHIIIGMEIKYIMAGHDVFFQIVNPRGDAVFACPAHLVMWCKTDSEPAPIVPIRKSHLSVVDGTDNTGPN